MTLEQLKDFFRKKPGYIKRGAGWLADFLELDDLDKIKRAKTEVAAEIKKDVMMGDKESKKLRLKSTWQVQKKGGEIEWLESYKAVEQSEYQLTKEDWENIIDKVGNISITYNKETTLPSNNKALIIWTSDKHIGASIPDDALYKKKYNEHVFFSRMEKIYQKAMSLFQTYGIFDKLIVADLGDSLDGYNAQTTRGGHDLPQNLNNKEAAQVHFYTHKWFYEQLLNSGISKQLEVVHISNDNHAGDFGWQASFALQQYGSVAYPDIKFSIPEEFLSHFVLYDRAYIITHGKDKKNRKHGLPLKINADTESFLMDYVIDRKLGNYKIHVRKGDLHMNDLDCSRMKMTYWNIGSIFGASDWIMDNYSITKASCVFEIVEKESETLNAQIFWLS
jgi:hypothetical protein